MKLSVTITKADIDKAFGLHGNGCPILTALERQLGRHDFGGGLTYPTLWRHHETGCPKTVQILDGGDIVDLDATLRSDNVWKSLKVHRWDDVKNDFTLTFTETQRRDIPTI